MGEGDPSDLDAGNALRHHAAASTAFGEGREGEVERPRLRPARACFRRPAAYHPPPQSPALASWTGICPLQVKAAFDLAEGVVETQREVLRGLVETVTPPLARHAEGRARAATASGPRTTARHRRASSRRWLSTRVAAPIYACAVERSSLSTPRFSQVEVPPCTYGDRAYLRRLNYFDLCGPRILGQW